MLLVATLMMVAVQAGPLGRATIVAKESEPPRRNFAVIYYDDSFLFAVRHFGDSRDSGGNTEPGFFVHSKEKATWIQITAISTAGRRFGKSTSDDPEVRKKLMIASVGWDFTAFAERPYIEQPLRTSGSIAFPDQFEFEADKNRYRLRYFSSWGVPTAETVLYIDRADLIAVFRERSRIPR